MCTPPNQLITMSLDPYRCLLYFSCRNLTYSSDLPQLSVIFIFVNEALSVLLRSVHTAIQKTAPHLLKEIILVDDHSSSRKKNFSFCIIFITKATSFPHSTPEPQTHSGSHLNFQPNHLSNQFQCCFHFKSSSGRQCFCNSFVFFSFASADYFGGFKSQVKVFALSECCAFTFD